MSSADAGADAGTLTLLLFAVGGVCCGVDVDQVDGIWSLAGDAAAEQHWFHEVMDFSSREVAYRLPTVLGIKTAGARPYQVIIDEMEEIAEFSWSVITPLPALLEPYALRRGIWGVLRRAGQLVLLIDFQRIAEKHAQ